MKTRKIYQNEVAEWAGISDALLSLVRRDKRHFSMVSAMKIESETGVPGRELVFRPGEDVYNTLLEGYKKS